MNYKIVENFEEATHWIPTYDEDSKEYKDITLDKPYRFYIDKYDNDVVIIDDTGIASMIYLCHNGILANFKNKGV